MSNNPVQKCFENPLIIESILKHTGHPVQRLHLRLVNRRFNAECLRRIQIRHRKIDLRKHFLIFQNGGRQPRSYMITVNDHVIRILELRKYFQFLVNVAKVKVTEFRGTMLWCLRGEEKWQLHRLIHDAVMQVLLRNQELKVMTGMQQVCGDGCDECERHADGCREYGPLQFEVLSEWTSGPKRHFERLIVWESLLWRIANLCVSESTSRKECLEMMKTLITPNITCNHLQLEVLENPERTYLFWPEVPHQAFPREIIEQMCRVWKVKTVGIGVNELPREHMCSSTWSSKNFFTKFRFNDPLPKTRTSRGFHLDDVSIDLERVYIPVRGIFGINSPRWAEDTNLIANTRRLFPTENVFVNKFRSSTRGISREEHGYPSELSNEHLKNMIDAGFKGNWDRRNGGCQTTLRYLISLTPMSLRFELPSVLELNGRCYSLSYPPTAPLKDHQWKRVQNYPFHWFSSDERLCRSISITEASSNRSLHLELYVEKPELDAVRRDNNNNEEWPLLKLFC